MSAGTQASWTEFEETQGGLFDKLTNFKGLRHVLHFDAAPCKLKVVCQNSGVD